MERIGALLFLIFCYTLVFGQTEETRKNHYNLKKGIAIEGYDPVSYFNGKPAEGKSEFKFSYNGVTYLFVSQSNLNKFKASPGRYEPAYGGWCAYAMGESGEKVKVDPETYKVLNGKLYLFYNFWGNNTLTDWNKNEKKLMESGNTNWARIVR